MDKMKLARDGDSELMQMSHVKTAVFEAHTAGIPTQFDTAATHNVCIVGSSDAFIRIELASTLAVINEGFLYIAGTYYHTEIKRGEWFDSTADVHICALGEAV